MSNFEQVLAGLLLISEYDDPEIGADHEIIYAGADKLPKEIEEKLKELNWYIDAETDWWAHYA